MKFLTALSLLVVLAACNIETNRADRAQDKAMERPADQTPPPAQQ